MHGSETYFYCTTPLYQTDTHCQGLRWSKSALEQVLLPIYDAQMALIAQSLKNLTHSQPEFNAAMVQHRMAALEKSILSCEKEKLLQYERYREGVLSRNQFLAQKELLVQKKLSLFATLLCLFAHNKKRKFLYRLQ